MIDIKLTGKKELLAQLSGIPDEVINGLDKDMPSIIRTVFDTRVKMRLSGSFGKPFTRTGELAESFAINKLGRGFWRYGQIPGKAMAHTVPYTYGYLLEYGFWHVIIEKQIMYPFFKPSIKAGLEHFKAEVETSVDKILGKVESEK